MTRLAPLRACCAASAAPRVERLKEHLLLDRIGSTSCARSCGAAGWDASAGVVKAKQGWRPQVVASPTGIPSPDTCGRVLAPIEPPQCPQSCRTGVQAVFAVRAGQGVAMEGTQVTLDNAPQNLQLLENRVQ